MDLDDAEEITAEDIVIFLKSLDAPNFTYQDVLDCYAELIGKPWATEGSVKRGPRIPTRSELSLLSKQSVKNFSSSSHIKSSDNFLENAENCPGHIDGSTRKEKSSDDRWTNEETEALIHGIKKHGWGKWRKILDCESVLRDRKAYRQVITRAKYLKYAGRLNGIECR